MKLELELWGINGAEPAKPYVYELARERERDCESVI